MTEPMEAPVPAAWNGVGAAAGTGPHRMPALYDVVAVCPGVVIEGHRYESVRLTIVAVSLDGREVDATEWTGGPPIHLGEAQFRLVSPQRGVQ